MSYRRGWRKEDNSGYMNKYNDYYINDELEIWVERFQFYNDEPVFYKYGLKNSIDLDVTYHGCGLNEAMRLAEERRLKEIKRNLDILEKM